MADKKSEPKSSRDLPKEIARAATTRPVVPGSIDEVTDDDLPVDLQADFMPLPEDGAAKAPRDRDIDPFQYDSLQAQEAFDAAVAAASAGQEEEAIQQYIRAAKIAETAHEWHLAAVACQRIGDFLVSPEPPYDLERAFRMYRRAVAAYEQSGLFAEARSLAYRLMYWRMIRAGELKLALLQRLELFLSWAVAGFGYKPWRVIHTAIVMVLLYGFLYWRIDGVVNRSTPGPVDLWHAVYFSGVTFATVGYGDFIPAPHAQPLALTEGFLGVFTMGLFVAVLANRLSRA